MTIRSQLLRFGITLPVMLVSVSAMAAGLPLLAHRAVYDLSLGKATGNGSAAPVSARGRIVYEFSGSACEGYVTTFRQLTELQMDEGNARVSDMRSTTFEEADGSGFRYRTDTSIDGRLVETIDGRARKADDGSIDVDLTKPVKAKADLRSNAFFPTAQILRIVDAAHHGDRTAELKVFDGSDNGQKVFDTLTVIGEGTQIKPTEKVAAETAALNGVQRWPVSISYFDPAKGDGEPNYVLGFDLYENGVSGRLRINYGNYVLNGELSQLELLPQKDCK